MLTLLTPAARPLARALAPRNSSSSTLRVASLVYSPSHPNPRGLQGAPRSHSRSPFAITHRHRLVAFNKNVNMAA